MVDRVDEFLFRGFIPEENRGGTYHVVLNLGGRLSGPHTPERAESMGWPLPAIMADLNRQSLAEVTSLTARVDVVSTEKSVALSEKEAALRDRDMWKARAEAAEASHVVADEALFKVASVSTEKKTLVDTLTLGLIKKI